MRKRATFGVFGGDGGWWAYLTVPGWYVYRGPYRFRWRALLAFPIARWTWRGLLGG